MEPYLVMELILRDYFILDANLRLGMVLACLSVEILVPMWVNSVQYCCEVDLLSILKIGVGNSDKKETISRCTLQLYINDVIST